MTHHHTTPPGHGRGWAYVGAILGGAVSIAANIAHSYIPPAGAPTDWTPDTGAVIGSVFWPVALFVAVEILTRTAWPTGKGWAMLRYGGLLPVALVAAVVSYRHLSGLLHHYGEDALTVTIGPLAVDGLMIMATGALLATATHTISTVAPTDHTGQSTRDSEDADTEPEPASVDIEPEAVPADQPVFAPWAQPVPTAPARTNGNHSSVEVSA